ncbi:energy-coupling factor transporter transmembrane component T [Spirochaeta cellobiosiphila]|uniref:energy-coupling factor transporter transmembrane component T n=1 Tax=Spirochaeta cellobiosiphila TaxID=504483 RepID=UPI00040D18EC|nr:energy-coupling factor transporter transmembrane component T [Spirochaeta cellobiosiphila]
MKKQGYILVLDPRTKLVLVLIISIFMISGGIEGAHIYPRIVLATIPFILLLFLKRMKSSILYGVLLLAASYSEKNLVYNTHGVLNIIITMISGIITRLLPSVIVGFYIMETTTVSQFLVAMERMHMPKMLTIPLSVMFRFFPTIREEYKHIYSAMRMRELHNKIFIINPIRYLEYCFVPLLSSIVSIGEDLSVSALTRGLGSPIKRTNICKIGFGLGDMFFLLVAVLSSVCYIL